MVGDKGKTILEATDQLFAAAVSVSEENPGPTDKPETTGQKKQKFLLLTTQLAGLEQSVTAREQEIRDKELELSELRRTLVQDRAAVTQCEQDVADAKANFHKDLITVDITGDEGGVKDDDDLDLMEIDEDERKAIDEDAAKRVQAATRQIGAEAERDYKLKKQKITKGLQLENADAKLAAAAEAEKALAGTLAEGLEVAKVLTVPPASVAAASTDAAAGAAAKAKANAAAKAKAKAPSG